PDSSGQLAGMDVRLRCPVGWGACAAYTQWIGEDSAGGALPLPYKFLSLWGVEQSYGAGRYRVFAEYANTHAYSLPWDRKPSFPGYINGVYNQGYTNGARWVGSAQGAGSQITTLGWMDAQGQRMFKLHLGKVGQSVGAYDPRFAPAPHGHLLGLSASQSLLWQGHSWVPELTWLQLSEGQDQRANRRQALRLGVTIRSTR
ncbi:MAG: capsule assembly Wzi family protein, partial [Betaproteobacteria bacterium]|nr:capsule assembly Wzi family protein [Betaproteobacteria bacterium]